MRLHPLLLGLLAVLPRIAAGHDGPHPHTHGEPVAAATDSQVRIVIAREFRVITSNGLPDHATGAFPNRGNPHTIEAQQYRFRVPLHPLPANAPVALRHNLFGVALNGVVFDPGTAEYWQNDRRGNWNYEALSGRINLGLDAHLAHVQPSGAYHYHGVPTGLIDALGGNADAMRLLGWAADGYPIYAPRVPSDPVRLDSPLVAARPSYRVKSGVRPDGPGGAYDGTFTADYEYVEGLGDLDAANGRTGVTPEFPEGTYYYVLTEAFPHIPRQFHGTPDASFEKGPPGGGPPGAGPPGGGPPGRPPFPPPGRRPPPPGF